MAVLAAGQTSQAQYAKRRSLSQGPRALGLLELAANGRAHLIPITILFQGKFYDAGAYKASPVPIALQPQTVYEAELSGVSQGLFTVTDARELKEAWIADGTWLPAGAAPPKPAHSADEKPIMGDVDSPPILRRPGAEKSGQQTQPPDSKKPAPQATAPPALDSASASTTTSSTSPEPSPPEDKDHPVLRRGKPQQANRPDDLMKPHGPIPSGGREKTADKPAVANASAAAASSKPAVQLIPAISDADGPDPRAYTYDAKPEEEQTYRRKMLALAGEEVRTRAKPAGTAAAGPASAAGKMRQQHRSAASPAEQPTFDHVQFRFFDLSGSNEPILVLTASARMPAASASVQNSDLEYFVTVVAHADIYGELRKLYSRVTDTRHLDAIPRMELIDAVDADGDGRGELLFRQISDAGSAFAVYRVTSDQLWPLFEGTPQ
jgi:hypothetical protein